MFITPLFKFTHYYILYLPNCWLEISILKVLRPATSAQFFLGFPVSRSECWDGSQVNTACFSCSPPDLNFLDPYFIFMYVHYNHCHRATTHLQLNIYEQKMKNCVCPPGTNPDKHPFMERRSSHRDTARVTEGSTPLWPAVTNGWFSHGRFVCFDDGQGKDIISYISS